MDIIWKMLEYCWISEFVLSLLLLIEATSPHARTTECVWSWRYCVSITAGADKYLQQPQSLLTWEILPIAPFPTKNKRQMLVGVFFFLFSVKKVLRLILWAVSTDSMRVYLLLWEKCSDIVNILIIISHVAGNMFTFWHCYQSRGRNKRWGWWERYWRLCLR